MDWKKYDLGSEDQDVMTTSTSGQENNSNQSKEGHSDEVNEEPKQSMEKVILFSDDDSGQCSSIPQSRSVDEKPLTLQMSENHHSEGNVIETIKIDEATPPCCEKRNPSKNDKKCLVAHGGILCGSKLDHTLWKTLVDEFKPACIICPFDRDNKALVVYDDVAKVSKTLSEKGILQELMQKRIILKPMPSEVIGYVQTKINVKSILSPKNSKQELNEIENCLKNVSGIHIKSFDDHCTWQLEGSLSQMLIVNSYLKNKNSCTKL